MKIQRLQQTQIQNMLLPGKVIVLYGPRQERQGQLYGFEFKWRSGAMKKSTEKMFLAAYPNAILSTVSQKNFVDFLQP